MPPTVPSKKLSDEETLTKMGYKLGKLLGEGSYAKVYYAEFIDKKNPSKKVILACKSVDLKKASESFVKKFFPRELSIMCSISHQHVIKIHSVLKETEKFYIFLEFCDRGDMLDFIRNHGALKEAQARVWFAQLLEGLAYLHDLDIVHRDLKCENLLLSSSFKVKIADLGFARYFKNKDALSQTYCGSVLYAPPEVVRGIPYNPKKMDIWSCGVILYTMVNSALPFNQDNGLGKLYDDQTKRNWKLRDKAKNVVSQQLKVVLYSLLEPQPAKRPPARELLKNPWIKMSEKK